jgi:adenylate cyclase
MGSRRGLFRDLRLRPSVLTLYLLLTMPVFFGMVAFTYVSNAAIAELTAQELIERFRAEAAQTFRERFAAIQSLVRSAAALGGEYPELYRSNRSIGYLFSILPHNDRLVSAYVGLEDGSFRQARRIEPDAEVQGRLPPPGTLYADRWIERVGDRRIDHYRFLDAERRETGRSEAETSYDPRVRLWYESTRRAGGLHITEPDVFFALGLIGFTVAAPFYEEGRLLGVAAVDLTLEGLSDYLADHRISPGTRGFLLDRRGRVIANSEGARTWTNEGGRVGLQHVAALHDPLVSQAYAQCGHAPGPPCRFAHAGQDFLASLTPMSAEFDQAWQLFTITPTGDFTQALRRNNNRLLGYGLLAVLAQVAIIYLLAAVVSAPLERLAVEVRRIQDLDGHELRPMDSPIREIATLSRAVAVLDAFVRSFAAYVPVSLVRHLLETHRSLELGGHSRFLTVFFSDIEGFSGHSEELPAQDLLLRISAYLDVVIRTVEAERGTIDKFIGDGVMAFWGAPALLDDHARRACIAALRVQHGMAGLNAAWAAQGLKPFRLRIGIHSDAVLVGNIGSQARMSYTVMGDGVNIAARLEGVNKDFGTRIIISHGVYKEAGEGLCVRPLEEVAVRGRRARIPVYELMGAFGTDAALEPDAATQRLARMTRDAYEALVAGDAALARQRYAEALAAFPGDGVCRIMLARLEAGAAAGGAA